MSIKRSKVDENFSADQIHSVLSAKDTLRCILLECRINHLIDLRSVCKFWKSIIDSIAMKEKLMDYLTIIKIWKQCVLVTII